MTRPPSTNRGSWLIPLVLAAAIFAIADRAYPQARIHPGGRYHIQSALSGRCLDVEGARQDPGTGLLQWDCHGGGNQVFTLLQVYGYWKIVATHSGQCLEVAGHPHQDGVVVVQNFCDDRRPGQHFIVQPAGATEFLIRTRASNGAKCVDLRGASHGNGAVIQQWGCHGQPNQLWRFW